MLFLNLLSPQKKEEASKQLIFISFQFLISIILIATATIGMLLLTTKLIMQNSFNQAVGAGALVTKEYGQLNRQVSVANDKINSLTTIQKEFNLWSKTLSALGQLTPKNIELSNININKLTSNLVISGFSTTRENLLNYKNQLELSGLVEKVDLPIDNLLQAENINFRMQAKLTELK